MKKTKQFIAMFLFTITSLSFAHALPETTTEDNLITFYFSGKTTGGYTYHSNTPPVPVGTKITGNYSFYANASDTGTLNYYGVYEIQTLNAQIGNYTIQITNDPSPYAGIHVGNHPYASVGLWRDIYSIHHKVIIEQRPYHINPFFIMSLFDENDTVFTDNSLPLTPPPIWEFETKYLNLGYSDESFAIYGKITCISLRPNGKCIKPMPEPIETAQLKS